MAESFSIESLRAAIGRKVPPVQEPPQKRFAAQARRYEDAVRALLEQIEAVARQIPELAIDREEGTEIFTSPAFPGLETTIADPRLKLSLGADFLLFDPRAKALLGALGQIEVQSSKPIPFLIEKLLYLLPARADSTRHTWGYRSVDDYGRGLTPFDQAALLRVLHAVFA